MSSKNSNWFLSQDQIKLQHKDIIFTICMWLTSRLVIVAGMQLIAPLLNIAPISFDEPGLDTLQIKNFTPQFGWELFTHWDGEHYRNIVINGYKYIPSDKQNNIAFFPVYPLVVKAFVSIGIPFDIAAPILSNLAFLATLLISYRWINSLYGSVIARWTIATMAWFPMSIFCSLAYTESFFLLFAVITLNTFFNQRYLWATFFGSLATATRIPGIVLIPTLLIFSWQERRPLSAYISALLMSIGIISFSIFCQVKFNEPFAFFLAQSGWPQPSWFDLLVNIIAPVFSSNIPYYIYIVVIAVIGGIIKFYSKLGRLILGVILLPLFAYFTALLQISLPVINIWLMWNFRHKLNKIFVIYWWCYSIFLFASGTKMSIHRHIYTILPLILAIAILVSRRPRFGYVTMALFGVLLLSYSIRFAWWDWIA